MKHHRFTNKQGFLTVRDSDSGGRYRSQLEMNACIRYIMNPAVKLVKLQHPSITYKDAQGKRRRYTADLWVEWNNPALRPLAVEVKYQKELNRDPALADKFRLVEQQFAQAGMDFIVLTEAHILAPDIKMMRFVFGYRNDAPTPVEDVILGLVKRRGEVRLAELLEAIAGDNIYAQSCVVPSVWRLVGVHQLRVDFSKTLDSTAKITLPAAM